MSRKPPRAPRLSAFVLACAAALAAPASAGFPVQSSAPVPQARAPQAGIEELAALRRELEADAAQTSPRLDEDGRRQALEALDAAERDLRAAAASIDRTAEFALLTEEAPARLAALREELARPPVEARAEVPEGATITEFEQLRAQAEAELAARRTALEELALEAQRRTEARATLPAELSRARQELEALDETLASLPPDPPGLAERARRKRLLAERERLRARVEEVTSELASYQARSEILPLRRERAQRRVVEAEQLLADWRRVEGERRRADAERASEEARRLRRQATAELAPLRAYALENERLAALRAGGGPVPSTLAQIEAARADLDAARSLLAQRIARYTSLRTKLEAVGLIPSMARLLSEEYERLGELRRFERGPRGRHARLSDAQLQALLFEDRLAELPAVQDAAAALLVDLPPAAGPEERAAREAAAAQLVTARHELVERLADDYKDLYDVLEALEFVSRSLATVTAEYRAYIEENILWIRSVPEVLPKPGAVLGAVAFVLDPVAWNAALRSVAASWPRSTLRIASLALAVMLLVGLRRRMLSALRTTGALVARYSTDSFWHTLRGLALTLLLALAVPLSMWSLGWLLGLPADAPAVALGVGAGLRRAAVLLLPLHVFGQVVRRGGLAEEHFRWPERATASLRRNLRWFLTAMYPVVVLVWALRASDPDHHNSLGRVTAVVGAVFVAVFARRMLRPTGAVLSPYYERNPGGWPARLRALWQVLGIGAPSALGIAAAVGYYYTALRLGTSLGWTVGLLLVVVLVHALLLRWLFVERRRLAVEQAKKRRADALAARGAEAESAEVPALVPEAELDLPAISAQTQQLFRSLLGLGLVLGLFFVWSDVLPALRVLDRVQVWPRIALLEPTRARLEHAGSAPAPRTGQEAAPTPVAPTAPPMHPRIVPTSEGLATDGRSAGVTLADLGLALIVLLVTLAAARNLPGLFEFTLFQRMQLDAGTRYAFQTLARYSILILGLSTTFGAIGIGWSEIQWLAAALTFGLAFGLQEIFANFVSGLIILFEQPIRVGDTVTVNGIDGRVSRISMRATTITDFNRKELLIPNKEFITHHFVNWTLSDSVTRIVVPVGVSYGSDTRRVRELLEKAAKDVPYVLEKPAPSVVFRQFGSSSLDFELRLFIDGMDRWGEIMTNVHTAIDDAFRAAGIEIAFPQLDLHLRTADAPLRVTGEGGGPA